MEGSRLPLAGRIEGFKPTELTGMYTVDSPLSGNFSAFADSAAHLPLPVAEWVHVLDTDLRGPLVVTQAIARGMAAQGRAGRGKGDSDDLPAARAQAVPDTEAPVPPG